VDIDASGYVMRVILMYGGKLVCYHSKMFHGVVLNYCMYDINYIPWFKFLRSGIII
jgi:hypothetical protein